MHILVKTPAAFILDLFAIVSAPFTNHRLANNAVASRWKFK